MRQPSLSCTLDIYLRPENTNISVRGGRRTSSEPDQSAESAIVSLSYLDSLTGQEKTIRGNADKLVIKRRRPGRQGSRETYIIQTVLCCAEN